jgi:hypothetical protein
VETLMHQRRQSLFAVMLLAASGAWSGCSGSDTTKPGTSEVVTAEQVKVADQTAVPAENVEEALQAMWPNGEALATLTSKVGELAQVTAELATKTAGLSPSGLYAVGEGGADLSVQEALDALSASVSALADENRKLAVENAQLLAQSAQQATEMAQIAARVLELESAREGIATNLETVVVEQGNLAALVNGVEATLTAKIQAPRDCPLDMVAVGEQFCIEKVAREPRRNDQAMAICGLDGRRLCSVAEVYMACMGFKELGGEIPGLRIRDNPHWTADGEGRLKVMSSPEWWDLSGIALGGLVCQSTWEAADAFLGAGTQVADYHFRCCQDRY